MVEILNRGKFQLSCVSIVLVCGTQHPGALAPWQIGSVARTYLPSEPQKTLRTPGCGGTSVLRHRCSIDCNSNERLIPCVAERTTGRRINSFVW